MANLGRFDFIDGPFARLLILGKISGTVFVDLGSTFDPMISHFGATAQFCDPNLASAAKQGTLDGMGRIVFSGVRDNGTPGGVWNARLSFSRLAEPEIQFVLTLADAVKRESNTTASLYTVSDTAFPKDFMRSRTGTVTESDTIRVKCEIEPGQDLTDTSVCVEVMLVPSATSTFGSERGRLFPA